MPRENTRRRRCASALLGAALWLALAAPSAGDTSAEAFFRLALAYGSEVDELARIGRADLAECDRTGDGRVDQRDLWDFTAAWLAAHEAEAGSPE